MKRTLKIGQLAPLGFGIIILLTLGINVLSQLQKRELVEAFAKLDFSQRIRRNVVELEKSLRFAESAQRAYLYTEQPQYLESYDRANTEISDNLNELEEILAFQSENVADIKISELDRVETDEQRDRLQQIEQLVVTKQQTLDEVITLKQAGNDSTARNIVANRDQQLVNSIETLIEAMEQAEQRNIDRRRQQAERTYWVTSYITWISTAITIVIGAVVSVIIARMVSRSLRQAIAVANEVADGNLAVDIEVNYNNEVGELLESFRSMSFSLNALVSRVQEAGIRVTSSTTQIASSSKQLEATLTEHAASTNQITITTQEIASTAAELSDTMDRVSTMAAETAGMAKHGQDDLDRMQDTIHVLSQATDGITARLGSIDEKANNINGVITAISQVADRTNLLSLNAAIEAEKAGEYGAGFGVVAREIRRLADRTSVSTLEIEQMVREMQCSVSSGVMEMDKFARDINHGLNNLQEISSRTGTIIDRIQALMPQFDTTRQGIEAQSMGAEQIRTAMEQLNESSQQTTEVVRENNRAIEQLNQVVQTLRQEIARFKIEK